MSLLTTNQKQKLKHLLLIPLLVVVLLQGILPFSILFFSRTKETMAQNAVDIDSHLVENLARELECCFIDLRRGFLLSHEYDRLLCADGIHPTQKGHEMIEKTIANFVCI